MNSSSSKDFRVGVLGGMGPMAGVLFQRLIIEAVPAQKDQDHIQVVCFTNPKIPDRTASLKEDGGKELLSALRESLRALVRTEVDVVVMACNTSYVRLKDIQDSIQVPILDITALAVNSLAGPPLSVGILATDGMLDSRHYQSLLEGIGCPPLVPDAVHQERVMEAIYKIKRGEDDSAVLRDVVAHLRAQGAEKVLLGCTEVSLCFNELQGDGVALVDPLRIAAAHLVGMSQNAQPFLDKDSLPS